MRRCLTLFVSLTLAAPAFAFERASTPAASAPAPAVVPTSAAPAPQKPAAPTPAPVAAKPLPPLPTPAPVTAEASETTPDTASHAAPAKVERKAKKYTRATVKKVSEPARIAVSAPSRQYLHGLNQQLDEALAK